MITIKVNNIYSEIVDLSDDRVHLILDTALSYYVEGYEFSKAFQKGYWSNKSKKWERWDGKKHLLDKKNRFNTGLITRVKGILDDNSVKYEILDERKEVPFKRKIKTKNIESREYQDRIHDACILNKGGVVKSATGSGKSVIITRLVAETNLKTMIMVIGTDLLYQFKETLESMLGTEVGIIGDGKAVIKKINVCSVWTAASALGKEYKTFDDEEKVKKERFDTKNKAKITKAIKSAEMIIYDECQFIATQTIQSINNASTSAYYKYGFSGTPFRDDNSDILLEAVCGPKIIDVTATELIRDGWLVQPTIHLISVPPYDGKLPDKYPSIYKTFIVENEVRNDKIIKCAKKLIAKKRKVLILVKNIRHGEILLSKMDEDVVVYFVKGDVSSDERNRIREEFVNGKIDLIIASVVYDQGINLPNLDALILAGSGKSSTRALQRIGRVIRPCEGKKDAIVIDFIDDAKYLMNHTARRVDIYRTEPGFKIKLPSKKGLSDGSSKEKEKKKSKSVQKRHQRGKVSW